MSSTTCYGYDAHFSITDQYWELTAQEQFEFKQLQSLLSDVVYWKNKPEVVVRYLRARRGNVDDAAQMFRNMVKWRLNNNVDSVLESYNPPSILREYFPGAILQGRDYQGDPIFVARSGSTDLAALIKRYGREEMVQHAIWLRESLTNGPWLEEYEREQGRPVRTVTLVEDLHGLSRKHLSRKVLSIIGEILTLDQANYCELAKKIIIIRAPTIFTWAWALAKPFFDPGVVEKMVFCGVNDYRRVLSEFMELEVLPSCIVPEGKGGVAISMPPRLEGGPPPIHEERDVESLLLSKKAGGQEELICFVKGKTICCGKF